MEFNSSYSSSNVYVPTYIKALSSTSLPDMKWLGMDTLPSLNTISPVWDGEYIYYAVYVENGYDKVWLVTEQMGINLDDLYLRKKHGDIVQVKAWMKIEAPR